MRHRVIAGLIAVSAAIVSGCADETSHGGSGMMNILTTIDGDAIKKSYKINELSGSTMQVRIINEGVEPVDFPCDLLKEKGMSVSYYPVARPEDEWHEGSPPLMPGVKYSDTTLRKGEQCSIQHDVPIDVLQSFLKDAAGRAVEIGIDISLPATIQGGDKWSGLSKNIRFQLNP